MGGRRNGAEGASMGGGRPATGGPAPDPGGEPAALAELRDREARLRALRSRRADLEVERIVAGVELRADRPGPDANVPGAAAAAIVDALDRLRRVEAGLTARRVLAAAGVRSDDEAMDRLHAGDDALGAWLDADRDEAGAAVRRIAKQVLLVVCAGIVALAIGVHVAFLVLLIPAAGATSFLLWTGQDRAWRRVGARRRFERLRLEAPAAWTENAVHERRRALSRLAERIRERASACVEEGPEADEAHLEDDLESARSELREALAAVGLDQDRLDERAEAALRATARVHRAEHALEGISAEMAEQREGAGAIRESLYRRLAREGRAAPDGDASTDALEAGLERAGRR